MSTSAEVSTAWAAVFADTTMQAITTQSINYAATDTSETEIANLSYDEEINFFQYITTRTEAAQMTHSEEHTFRVVVTYTLEWEPTGANFNAVRTAFETLFAAVKSVLGNTWTSTVEYWRLVEGITEPQQVTIAGTSCWQARAVYVGTKRETI